MRDCRLHNLIELWARKRCEMQGRFSRSKYHRAIPGHPPGDMGLAGKVTRKFSGLRRLLFSPGFALGLTIVGYYTLAGFTNAFMSEGSLGAILIRLFLLLIAGSSYFAYRRQSGGLNWQLLAPAGVFFGAYGARIVENCFILGLDIQPGPGPIFAIMFLSIVIPSYVLAHLAQLCDDDDFFNAMAALNVVFLVGMLVNLATLQETAETRMTLDKINPIVLSHTAAGYLIFHLLFFKKSKSSLWLAVASAPLLFFVIVYARSRGPYIAGIGALLIYALLLKGTRKIWAFSGFCILAAIALSLATDQIDVVWQQLSRVDVDSADESTRLHYIGAVGAWRQFMNDFFFGRYMIELETWFYPHNIFLEVPMALGIFGTIPFVGHLVLATRAAIGIIRSTSGVTASLAATFVAIMFIRESIAAGLAGSVWGSTGFWVCSFAVIGLWHARPLPTLVGRRPYAQPVRRH